MKKLLSLFFTSLMFVSAVQAKDLRFVQVTDVRYSHEDKDSPLTKIVNDINKQKNVEFVVFTGDNINKPTPYDLEGFLKEAKKLNRPFYIVIGDKDVNKLKHMSKVEYVKAINKQVKKYKPEKPNYTFEKDGVVFIVVDGAKDVIPGTNGYYRDDVLEWLEGELTKYQKNNVVILQHFPIIPPSQKESYYTFKPELYMQVLAKHKNVKAVVSGHFGVNSEKTIYGVRHITTAGGNEYRIIDILDCETENPTFWAQLRKL